MNNLDELITNLEYTKKLINQYKQANGIVDNKITNYLKEYKEFFINRREIGKNYIKFLDSLGFNYSNLDTAEIGKGIFDSIVIEYPTTIITPYYEYLDNLGSRVIKREFASLEGMPALLEETEVGNKVNLLKNSVNTFMIQNPYTIYDIESWDKLHNRTNYNILLGVYGNNFDKDKKDKIKLIKEFKEKLNNEFISMYETNNDEYYYIVGSNRIKKLI